MPRDQSPCLHELSEMFMALPSVTMSVPERRKRPALMRAASALRCCICFSWAAKWAQMKRRRVERTVSAAATAPLFPSMLPMPVRASKVSSHRKTIVTMLRELDHAVLPCQDSRIDTPGAQEVEAWTLHSGHVGCDGESFFADTSCGCVEADWQGANL